MSSIDDEIVRAKMRKLRVSTFADIYRWYAEHAHERLAPEYLAAQGASSAWAGAADQR